LATRAFTATPRVLRGEYFFGRSVGWVELAAKPIGSALQLMGLASIHRSFALINNG
jgi:hypothetical protein